MRYLPTRALLAVLFLLPAAPYLWHLPDFGRIPYNDYWIVLDHLVDGESLDLSPANVATLKSNEHTVVVPAALYLVNVAMTGGDNRGHSVLVLCFLAVTLWLLLRMLPADLRARPEAWVPLGLTLSLFVFNVVQSHNVVMGFSGVMWMLSNLAAVAAIAALARASRDPSRRWIWLSAGAGIVGALSYSTNLSLWPALLVSGLMAGIAVRRLLPIVGLAAGVYVLYTGLYETPTYHPGLETSPARLARFTASYLGSLFSSDPGFAATLGIVGVAVSLGLAVPAVTNRARRKELAPWFGLQLYAFGNAIGTAVGRGGKEGIYGLASRYASLPALFWSGLLVSLFVLWWRSEALTRRSRAATLVAMVSLVGIATVAMFTRGWEHYQSLLRRAAEQPVAATALHLGVLRDGELLAPIVPWPSALWTVRPWMVVERHVPFDRPTPIPLGERIDAERLRNVNPRNVLGSVDRRHEVSPEAWRIEGWAHSPNRTVHEILVLDREGVVRGGGVPGRKRDDVGRVHGHGAQHSGWLGLAVAKPGTPLRVYAVMAENGKLVPLGDWSVYGSVASSPSARSR